MIRVFFRLLALLLGLLTLLVVAAWLDSHWHRRVIEVKDDRSTDTSGYDWDSVITSDSGSLAAPHYSDTPGEAEPADVWTLLHIPPRGWKLSSSPARGYPELELPPFAKSR